MGGRVVGVSGAGRFGAGVFLGRGVPGGGGRGRAGAATHRAGRECRGTPRCGPARGACRDTRAPRRLARGAVAQWGAPVGMASRGRPPRPRAPRASRGPGRPRVSRYAPVRTCSGGVPRHSRSRPAGSGAAAQSGAPVGTASRGRPRAPRPPAAPPRPRAPLGPRGGRDCRGTPRCGPARGAYRDTHAPGRLARERWPSGARRSVRSAAGASRGPPAPPARPATAASVAVRPRVSPYAPVRTCSGGVPRHSRYQAGQSGPVSSRPADPAERRPSGARPPAQEAPGAAGPGPVRPTDPQRLGTRTAQSSCSYPTPVNSTERSQSRCAAAPSCAWVVRPTFFGCPRSSPGPPGP